MKTQKIGFITRLMLVTLFIFSASIAVNAQSKPGDKIPEEKMLALVKRHFEVLNVQDSVKRLTLMKDVYTSDFHIVDTFFELFNYKDWNSTVNVIHKTFPGAQFSIEKNKTIPNAVRSYWKLGTSLTGENIFLFREGKIATIIAFVEQTGK